MDDFYLIRGFFLLKCATIALIFYVSNQFTRETKTLSDDTNIARQFGDTKKLIANFSIYIIRLHSHGRPHLMTVLNLSC